MVSGQLVQYQFLRLMSGDTDVLKDIGVSSLLGRNLKSISGAISASLTIHQRFA